MFFRVELFFWNWTIQILSRPGFTRSFMLKTMRLVRNTELASFGIFLGVSAVFGLVSGYLFFFVAASLK